MKRYLIIDSYYEELRKFDSTDKGKFLEYCEQHCFRPDFPLIKNWIDNADIGDELDLGPYWHVLCLREKI